MTTIFVTGASGAGKTSILREVSWQLPEVGFYYFDDVGVPSEEQMAKEFGSGENWQAHTTKYWISRMLEDNHDVSVLEGSMRVQTILDSCAELGLKNPKIVLVDCDDSARAQHLSERGQRELATGQMVSWAQHLREEAQSNGEVVIVDTSNETIEQSAAAFVELIRSLSLSDDLSRGH